MLIPPWLPPLARLGRQTHRHPKSGANHTQTAQALGTHGCSTQQLAGGRRRHHRREPTRTRRTGSHGDTRGHTGSGVRSAPTIHLHLLWLRRGRGQSRRHPEVGGEGLGGPRGQAPHVLGPELLPPGRRPPETLLIVLRGWRRWAACWGMSTASPVKGAPLLHASFSHLYGGYQWHPSSQQECLPSFHSRSLRRRQAYHTPGYPSL